MNRPNRAVTKPTAIPRLRVGITDHGTPNVGKTENGLKSRGRKWNATGIIQMGNPICAPRRRRQPPILPIPYSAFLWEAEHDVELSLEWIPDALRLLRTTVPYRGRTQRGMEIGESILLFGILRVRYRGGRNRKETPCELTDAPLAAVSSDLYGISFAEINSARRNARIGSRKNAQGRFVSGNSSDGFIPVLRKWNQFPLTRRRTPALSGGFSVRHRQETYTD